MKDYNFEDDFGYFDERRTEEPPLFIPENQRHCWHDWMPIQLIFSTVYNCKKCGMKKEDYEI